MEQEDILRRTAEAEKERQAKTTISQEIPVVEDKASVTTRKDIIWLLAITVPVFTFLVVFFPHTDLGKEVYASKRTAAISAQYNMYVSETERLRLREKYDITEEELHERELALSEFSFNDGIVSSPTIGMWNGVDLSLVNKVVWAAMGAFVLIEIVPIMRNKLKGKRHEEKTV